MGPVHVSHDHVYLVIIACKDASQDSCKDNLLPNVH